MLWVVVRLHNARLDIVSGAAQAVNLQASAPLGCHCVGDPGVGAAPLHCPCCGRPQFVLAAGRLIGVSFLDDYARGHERRYALEPEARCIAGIMSELPRLDDLIWFPDLGRDNADRIFHGYALDWRGHEITHKLEATLLAPIGPFLRKIPGARHSEMGARGKRNHHVPHSRPRQFQRITNDMRPRRLRGYEITRHGVMPTGYECVPHHTATLTSY